MIKPQSNLRLILHSSAGISQLSAPLTRQSSGWNKPITRSTVLQLCALTLTQRSVSFVCFPLKIWHVRALFLSLSSPVNQSRSALSLWRCRKPIAQNFYCRVWSLVPILLPPPTSLLGVVAQSRVSLSALFHLLLLQSTTAANHCFLQNGVM